MFVGCDEYPFGWIQKFKKTCVCTLGTHAHILTRIRPQNATWSSRDLDPSGSAVSMPLASVVRYNCMHARRHGYEVLTLLGCCCGHRNVLSLGRLRTCFSNLARVCVPVTSSNSHGPLYWSHRKREKTVCRKVCGLASNVDRPPQRCVAAHTIILSFFLSEPNFN